MLMFSSNKMADSIHQSNQGFYNRLWDSLFCEAFPRSQANFYNAHELYDYAAYRWTHDNKTRAVMTSGDLERLRHLAWQEQALKLADTFGSDSAQPDLTASIAGRTLCSRVADLFAGNIDSRGERNKLNLAFTSHEPFLGFFALANLAAGGSGDLFSQLPGAGATLTFELFSMEPDENLDSSANSNDTNPTNQPSPQNNRTPTLYNSVSRRRLGNNKTTSPLHQSPQKLTSSTKTPYPPTNTLYVRFLYQGPPSFSSSPSNSPAPYALFGSTSTSMPFGHFNATMRALGIADAAEWCGVCESEAAFCVGAVPRQGRRQMHHVLAGVLGAAGTLAALGVLALL